MKSPAKYGLENLNTVHEVFSLGLSNNNIDKAIIATPRTWLYLNKLTQID